MKTFLFFLSWFGLNLLSVLSHAVPTGVAKLNRRRDLKVSTRANPSHVHECWIAVKLRNLETLEKMLIDIAMPYSSKYGKHLSQSQLGELTKNSPAISAIVNYLEANGIRVIDSMTSNGEFVKAEAPISTWESLLQAEFYEIERVDFSGKKLRPVIRALKYHMPTELEDYASTILRTVQMPLRVRRSGIRSRNMVNTAEGPPIISFGTVTPALLNNYYNITSNIGNLLGSQSVWESIEQDYSPEDLTGFQTNFQLPIEAVAKDIGGYNLSSTCVTSPDDCGEANLDVQYMMAVSQVTPTVYYYDNSTDFFISWAYDLLNMTDPPLVNSISYGCSEYELDEEYAQTANNLFMMLAARGVTITVSSGDDGAPGSDARYNESNCGYFPDWPASVPYVLSVGATQGPETNQPEIACASNTGGDITSGGGFSNLYQIPEWQFAEVEGEYFSYISISGNEPAPGFNISGRGYPDISALGFNYNVLLGGEWYLESGTSASSPVVAAMVALVNAERLARGESVLGWFNPTLYNNASDFTNDITSGDNRCCAGRSSYVCCQQGFIATPSGWDPVTGLGSLNFANFYKFFLGFSQPSAAPTAQPTTTPTAEPSPQPTIPTAEPSPQPTTPTAEPSPQPTTPTAEPSPQPTTPTALPSPAPTAEPSPAPTKAPTRTPTRRPTASPTRNPTNPPVTLPPAGGVPTQKPSSSPIAAGNPTPGPTSVTPASFSVSQLITGIDASSYALDPQGCNAVIAETAALVMDIPVGYITVAPLTFASSLAEDSNERRKLQTTASSATALYFVDVPNAVGYSSPAAAVYGLTSALQESITTGYFSSYLQAYAAASTASSVSSALGGAESDSPATFASITAPTPAPNSPSSNNDSSSKGLSSGSVIAIAVIFSLLGAALLAYGVWYYIRNYTGNQDLKTGLLNP